MIYILTPTQVGIDRGLTELRVPSARFASFLMRTNEDCFTKEEEEEE